MVTRIEFGGRILRHRYIEFKNFNPAKVPPREDFSLRSAVEKLFSFGENDLDNKRVALDLINPLMSGGYIDAEKIARQICSQETLLKAFLAREGEERIESNVMKAVIGRLGDPDVVLAERKDAQVVVDALEALLRGDVEGYNQIRRDNLGSFFDFSGIIKLSEVNLKGGDYSFTSFRGTYPLAPAAARNRLGFVRINSGFCAGMPIAPGFNAPEIVFGKFMGRLTAEHYNAWLALNERGISEHTAQIGTYPRRPQRKEGGAPGFKYEDFYLGNLPGIRKAVREVLEAGRMPVTIGGDHSIAFGTQGTINDYYFERTGKSIGLVWIDAHADINTDTTTESGNFHGGPVAGLLGYIEEYSKRFGHVILPRNIVYIAMRDPDRGEVDIIEQRGIRWIKVDDIRKKGVEAIMQEAYRIATDGTAGVSVSFDIDGYDEALVPGTGTRVKDGLTLEMGREICRAISKWEKLLAFELVEINPANDVEGKTVELGVTVLLESLVNLELHHRMQEREEAGRREIEENDLAYLLSSSHPPEKLELAMKVSDAGLIYLLQKLDLSRLAELDLNFTQTTDAGLKFLSELTLPELARLHLQKTQISDEGLRMLARIRMPKLAYLDVRDTRVTEEAKNKIKEKIDGLIVEEGEGGDK